MTIQNLAMSDFKIPTVNRTKSFIIKHRSHFFRQCVKCSWMLLTIFLSTLVLSKTSKNHISICNSMLLKTKSNAEPQTSTVPFQVLLDKETVHPGDIVTLLLSSNGNKKFTVLNTNNYNYSNIKFKIFITNLNFFFIHFCNFHSVPYCVDIIIEFKYSYALFESKQCSFTLT